MKLLNCEWINADNMEHLTAECLVLGNLGLRSQRFGAGTWMLGAKQAPEKAGLALCAKCPALPSSPPNGISTGSLNVCLPWAPVCLCSKSSHTPALQLSLPVRPVPCSVGQTPPVSLFIYAPTSPSVSQQPLTNCALGPSLSARCSVSHQTFGSTPDQMRTLRGQCLAVW